MTYLGGSRAATQPLLTLGGKLPDRSRPFASEYRLDSSRVDVKLARALYRNIDPRYKLGAGFAKPAINIPVGFIGSPILHARGGPDEAQSALDDIVRDWAGQILKVHRATLIDGEVLARVQMANRSPAYAALYGEDDMGLELSYVPAEAFEILSMDEDIDAVEAVRVKHLFIDYETNGTPIERSLYETVSANQVELVYENDFKPRRVYPNPLGFVPAVRVQNENLRHELRGRSEIENLEPYLRFYHDVMLHAGSASKLHSTAKLVIRAQDVERFLSNNFTDAELRDGTLRFRDKDVLFFESGLPEIGTTGTAAFAEGAEVIQARAPLGDTNTLLEYIFLNIVDASEVPEWAFGGAIASSKASVTEQSAPLIHKVNRKRSEFEAHWALLGRMALKMKGIAVDSVRVEWEDLSQKDTKAEAEAIKALSDAMIALNDAELISKISAVDVLRPYLDAILPYDADDESREERQRLESEIEEREAAAQAAFEAQQEQLEDDDQQAGLRAIG